MLKKMQKILPELLTPALNFNIVIFTFSNEPDGCLAQLVEQWTVNPCVAGSNPAGAA